jgi:hypothetical protein
MRKRKRRRSGGHQRLSLNCRHLLRRRNGRCGPLKGWARPQSSADAPSTRRGPAAGRLAEHVGTRAAQRRQEFLGASVTRAGAKYMTLWRDAPAHSDLAGNTSTRSVSEMKVSAPARAPPPITCHRPLTTADPRPWRGVGRLASAVHLAIAGLYASCSPKVRPSESDSPPVT